MSSIDRSSYLDGIRAAVGAVAVICTPIFAQSMPGPGQTIHWTQAMSPVMVTGQKVVPAGATLIVDPGVHVFCDPNSEIIVQGHARFDGTSAAGVQLASSDSIFSPAVIVQGNGRLELAHTDVTAIVATAKATELFSSQGTILCESSTFKAGGGIFTLWGTVVLRDCHFEDAILDLRETWLFMDGGSLSNTIYRMYRRKAAQPIVIEGVTAAGNTAGAPFELNGFDHYFAPGNTIQGNLYPVTLTGGGIAPGSTLPKTGNVNNFIHVPQGIATGTITFADVGLIYRVDHDPNAAVDLGGNLIIEPGVTVRFMPDAYLWATFSSRLEAVGTPQKPITFEAFIPGTTWLTWNYTINSTRPHPRFAVVRDCELGLISDETVTYIDDMRFDGNLVGCYTSNSGLVVVRGSTFIGNGVGIRTSPGLPASGFGAGHADADGDTNPNRFQGNTIGVEPLNPNTQPKARYNWWGHPTGPAHVSNPAGQGDPAAPSVLVSPWLTAEPSNTYAPLVRLKPVSFLQPEGNALVLTWDVQAEMPIVKHQVWFAGHDYLPLELLVDDIDANDRSVEIGVPQMVPSNLIGPAVLRVVTIDALGRRGFDEVLFGTPSTAFAGDVKPVPIAGPLKPGQQQPINYTVSGGAFGTTDAFLFIDSDQQAFSLGGAHTGVTSLALPMDTPPVSTDLARVGIRYLYGNNLYKWEFTPYFSIRPDPLVGDAPPSAQLISPQPGSVVTGGSSLKIQWTASDDDFIRDAQIHATYDAGKTWNVIALNLPPSQNSYAWKLPASVGISDVRVRVVVRDRRFQASSAVSGPIQVLSGAGCYADCDGSGLLDLFDFLCFTNAFNSADPYADCDGSGMLDLFDFLCFTNEFNAGCP